MSTPSIQTLITQAQQVLNLKSTNEIRATLAAVLANANVGTPLNPNLTTQQLWDEFYEIVRQPSDDIMSIVVDQMMRMVFSPPAPGGAGADKQVIFNDGGVLAGDAGLTYNKATDALTITGDLTVDTSTLKVDSTNNRVGIGTASPGKRCEINQSANAITTIGSGEILRLIGDDGNTNSRITEVGFGSGPTGATFAPVIVGAVNTNISGYGTKDFYVATRAGVADVAPLERLRVTSAGNVNVTTGNVVMATSGKGIDFSATTEGSGTMTSELLNDYEEGTWTGTLTGGTTNPTTPVTATGRYTKVGRVVTVQITFLNANTTGASGLIGITGLPFANNGSSNSTGAVSLYLIGTFTGSPFASLGVNESFINLFANVSGGAFNDVTHNAGTPRFLTTSITYTV